MKAEKILVKGVEYYVNSESLEDPKIEKLFLFEDPKLDKVAKNAAGLTKMVAKSDIEEVLKENIGGAGGAGYAVWGGGWGRSFGNPSMGGKFAGRGFGFGGSNNLGGGPNLMYTYSVVPLNQLLQPPGTPQGDERYIHVGSEIEGKVLGKDQDIHGKIISIEEDEEGNVLHYLVQDLETAEKYEVDPTSVSLVTHEESPDSSLMDYVGVVTEEFYPSFASYLNEGKSDAREACKKSKLPKEIKEKVLKLGLSKFENGKAYGLGKPKVKGKSFNGVSLGADKNGFFVYTHRARSKSSKSPEKIPDKSIKFIKSTG